MTVYGGIEAGGSKWECAVGTGPADLRAAETIPTTIPQETHRPGRRLLRTRGAGRRDRDRLVRPARPEAVVADLGPHHDDAEAGLGTHRCRRRRSAGDSRCPWPSIRTSTPPRSASTAGARPRGSTPFATSPSAPGSAAAACSAGSCCTGWCIPNSATFASRTTGTPTPFQASAPTTETAGKDSRRAVRSRRAGAGRPPSSPTTTVWELQARYLAFGLVSVICVLSPERIVLGGGVMTRPELLGLVQHEVVGLMNGYLDAGTSVDGISSYITLPALGSRSGVLGAIALAETA